MSFRDSVKCKNPETIVYGNIIKELKSRGKTPDPAYEQIIVKCIRDSGDLDYAEALEFSVDSIPSMKKAFREGCVVITDNKMVQAGINREKLESLGCEVVCFIGHQDVVKEAKETGASRGSISMRKALLIDMPVIFAVGGDPEALKEIEKIREDGLVPAGVIGVTPGLLNGIDRKESLFNSGIPCIITRGAKGGNHIACAVINAIICNL